MTEENQNIKPIAVLTAPGAVSEETLDILSEYYRANKINNMILSDGLTISKGEPDVNGITPFYLHAPGSVAKKSARQLRDYAELILLKAGYKDFAIVILPEGLSVSLL